MQNVKNESAKLILSVLALPDDDIVVVVHQSSAAKGGLTYAAKHEVFTSFIGKNKAMVPIVLAGWQLARSLRAMSRQTYIVGRTLLSDEFRQCGKRAARFRITRASRMVNIDIAHASRPTKNIIICDVL